MCPLLLSTADTLCLCGGCVCVLMCMWVGQLVLCAALGASPPPQAMMMGESEYR